MHIQNRHIQNHIQSRRTQDSSRLHTSLRTRLCATALTTALTTAALLLPAMAQAAQGSPQAEQCVADAAAYHSVNPQILRAIMVVESGFRPDVASGNSNGTIDYGMAGINSLHINDGMKLARFGIDKQRLKDPCVAAYVGGWHLSRTIARYGNNWFGIAAYHSATPKYNARYQVMIHNALVRMGAYDGDILPVPRLR